MSSATAPGALYSSSSTVIEKPASTWWRWPLVPVGAIAGAVLAGLLLTLSEQISLGFLFGTDNIYFHYLVPFEAAAVGGATFGYLGCAIAPRGKRLAGVVLATLLGVFTAFGVIYAWGGDDVAHPLADTLRYLATFAAAVVAIAAFDE